MWMSHEKQDIKTDQPTLWFHLDEDGLLDHVLLVVDQDCSLNCRNQLAVLPLSESLWAAFQPSVSFMT